MTEGEGAVTDDPQEQEDEVVKRHRDDPAPEEQDKDEIIARWLRYAAAEKCHAKQMREKGEQPFDRLRDARAKARIEAANLLRETEDINSAVDTMMTRVRQLHIREPPILGFDDAMVSYTTARTLQACAIELRADTPEIQPNWEKRRS